MKKKNGDKKIYIIPIDDTFELLKIQIKNFMWNIL